MAIQNIPDEKPFYEKEKGATAKTNFNEQKQKFVKNPDFQKLSDVKKQAALSMFFDKYGTEYLKSSGIDDPERINKMKTKWTGDTFNEVKGIIPETEKKKPVGKVSLPDYIKEEANRNNQILSQTDKLRVSPLIDLDAERETKEYTQKMVQEIPNVTEELLNSEDFGYLKSSPELHERYGDDIRDNVDKWLKKNTEMSYKERGMVQDYLAQRAEDDMIKQLRKNYPGDLNVDVEEAAKPYLEKYEDGSFLDPTTDERVKNPDTKESAEFLSMMDDYSNDLMSILLQSDPQNPLSTEGKQIEEEYKALEDEGKDISKLINQEPAWLRGMTYHSVENILNANKDKNFVKRIIDPTTLEPLDRGNGDFSTHSMAYGEEDGKYYVYPTVVEKDGKLVDLEAEGINPFDYAIKNKEYIEFKTEKEAALFSGDAGYKQHWYEKGYLEKPKDMPDIPEAEDDKEYLQKYAEWIKKVNALNAEYSKKVDAFNEKSKAYNEKLQEQLPKEPAKSKSINDRLTEEVQNKYLKWQHYEDLFASASRQVRGEEPSFQTPSNKQLARLNELRNMAKADFLAGSRMLYNNEGPLQINRKDGYKAEIFGQSMIRGFGYGGAGEALSYYDEPTQQEILGSMYKIGKDVGVQFTDEEKDAFNATLSENIVAGTGALIPELPKLIMLGELSEAIKGAVGLAKFANGYKIVKNSALGRAAWIGIDETPGMGWTVVKTYSPNLYQKVAGKIAMGIIDEAVYTSAGFPLGAATGMAASRALIPGIKLKGGWQMFNPIMDLVNTGTGATSGMEAGNTVAGLVESALSDRPVDDIFNEMYPGVLETSKRILEEFIVNTLLFGGQSAIIKSAAKAKTAPAGTQFNKFGNMNWTGYIDPRARNRYYQAAKEFEAKGFTDTASELYKWLDIYKDPIKGNEIKEARTENLEKSLEILPTGQLREMRDVYQLMIKVLEHQGRQPDFKGTIEAPIRRYSDVKPGSVVHTQDMVKSKDLDNEGKPKWETVRNNWEITKTILDKNGNPAGYEAIHTETGEQRQFKRKTYQTAEGTTSYFDFDPTVSIKLENSLQVPFMMEAAYEHYNALSKILSGRDLSPKIEGLPPGPAGTSTPEGVDLPIPPAPTKISRKREEIAQREKAMMEDTGKEPIAIEPPKKENKFGDPEKILSTPAKEFSDKIQSKNEDFGNRLEGLKSNLKELQDQLSTNFKGRLTLEDRKKRDNIQNEIDRNKLAIEKAENEFNGELGEWLDLAKPQLSTAITDIIPGAKEEEIQNILDDLWQKMVNPTEEEADLTIHELLKQTIDEKATEGQNPVQPVQPEKPVETPKEDGKEEELPKKEVTEYKYLLPKPFDTGTQPKDGFLKGEKEGTNENETVFYNRELTPEEIEKYGLTPIAEEIPKVETPKETPPPKETPKEVEPEEGTPEWVIKNSTDPQQIYDTFQEEKASAPYNQLPPWQQQLLGFKVTKSSFENASDGNYTFQGLAKSWFAKKADGKSVFAIENIADEISGDNSGLMLTKQDIVDFILAYPTKAVRKTTDLMNPLKARYREVTGHSIDHHLKKKDLNKAKEAVEKNPDLWRVFEKIEGEDGNLDFDTLLKGLENDKGYFTQFPFGFSEQDIEDLINIINDENKRQKLQESYLNGKSGEDNESEDIFGTGDKGTPDWETEPPKEPEVKPKEQETPPEPPKPKEEPPKPKDADIQKDIDDMLGLLDDLDFDIGPVEGAGGTAAEDPKVKMLNIATGLVKKMTDTDQYGFDEIMAKLIPVVPLHKLKVLLPFIKQGYVAHWVTASPEVQAKMDVNRANAFQESDLTPEAKKPEPPKESPKVVDKEAEDIINGKVIATPLEHTPVTPNDVYNFIEEQVKRGEPLKPYLEKYVPKELFDKIVKIHNEVLEFRAKLGYDVIPNYMPLEFKIGSPAIALYNVGAKARAFERGNQGASIEKVKGALKYLEETVNQDLANLTNAREAAVTLNIKHHIWNGIQLPKEEYKGIVAIANEWGVTNKGAVRDSYERALVEIARTMAQDTSKTSASRFSAILNLYESNPKIPESARTSQVSELQQFSTPVPLGFLMGEYVNGLEVDWILEPQGGIGSLLIAVNKAGVRANDLDPRRARSLISQGYRATTFDSSHGLKGKYDVDQFPALLMNPPFNGPVEVYHGVKLTGEHVNVAYNLESLADHGKSAFIIGNGAGLNEGLKFDDRGRLIGKSWNFFNWLYKHYNVDDVIPISGKLYENMGTKAGTILVLINGRKAAPEGFATIEADKVTPVDNWRTLEERINSHKTKPNEKSILQRKVDALRGNDSLVDSPDTPKPSDKRDTGVGGVRKEEDPKVGTGSETPRGEVPVEKPTGGDTGKWGAGPGGSDIESPGIPKPTGGLKPKVTGSDRGGFGAIPPKTGEGDLPVRDTGKPTERVKRELQLTERTGDEVAPYMPLSRMGGNEYTIPASIAPAIEDALMQLKEEIGDVDEYVKNWLRYSSLEEMRTALNGAQVDAVASGIFNIEAGEAMIIGHQTGAGKGRIAAGIAAYAIENGKLPIFITKGANLFTEIWRDFIDIGRPAYQPFIMNKQAPDTGQKVKIFNKEDGSVIHEADPGAIDKIVGKGMVDGSFELPEGTNMIFTTYSQFANEKNAIPKRNFLMDIAKRHDVIFIMDESHGAAGMSKTGQFFMDWLQETAGGIFLSATYAKRPDNMPLYAMKTVMRETNMPLEQLVEAIQAGGPALQEIITSQLAESGQFSKVGIKLNATWNYHILGDTDPTQKTYDPELGKEMIRKYDAVTDVIRKIIDFQRDHINTILDAMDEAIKREGKKIGQRKGTKEAGISNQPYFSRVWNVIDQLLFAIKAKEMLPLIIEDLNKGVKPVITFRNTMEAVFTEMEKNGDLKKGDTIDMDFSYILKRGMNTIMKYTETDSEGVDHKKVLQPEDLDPIARGRYFDLMELISKTATGIPLSPIDVLRKGIKDAEFKSIEITGRSGMFELSDDMMSGKYVSNNKGDKIKAVYDFNNNPGYAAFLNTAGSTGISMHPQAKNKDHSPASMFPVQMMLDINEAIQMFGRIGRVGQIHKPTYNMVSSSLPAEQRMFMMMAKKLKSLDANTSGNQKQSSSILDTPDFLNKHGDDIVIEFLKENPMINDMIGDPFRISGSNSDSDIDKQNAAHKATGRIQILPSELQKLFNDEVIERYLQRIEYLDATGQNDLMVTTENLKAKEISSELSIEGKGGFSKFGDQTMLKSFEVDVLKKPFNKEQLDAEMAKTPENHREEIISAMEKGLQERLEENMNKAQEAMYDSMERNKKRIFDKKGTTEDLHREWELKQKEIETNYKFRIQTLTADMENLKEDYLRTMRFFKPGRVVDVPFNTKEMMDTVRLNQGVFLSYDINMNKPNPWVPSNINLKFATLDSRKMFKIPLSQMSHVGLIMRLSSNISPYEQKDILENWDKKKKFRDREIRYIVTGNILQGMNKFKEGRLIQFTTDDGGIETGIMMPENWKKPDTSNIEIPIVKMTDIIRKLEIGTYVESPFGDIAIKRLPQYGDKEPHYELKVPAAKDRGEKFYANATLKSLMLDEFERRGDRMVGTFSDTNLGAVIDLLDKRFKTIMTVSGGQIRQGHDSTESEGMVKQYPSSTTVNKPKDRRGLSDPSIEPIGAQSNPLGERVNPSPITGEKPKRLDKIVFDIGSALGGKNVAYDKRPGGKGSRGAAGVHYPKTNFIVVKFRNDLNVAAHEIGHYMDKLFGILGPEAFDIMDDLRDELQYLWDYGSKPPKNHPDPEGYKMREGVAEFVRAMIVNPTETRRRFPVMSAWFEQRVSRNEKVWAGFQEFSRDVRVYYGSSNLDKIGTNMDLDLDEPNKNPLVFSRTNREGHYQTTLPDKLGNRFWFMYESGVIAWKWAMKRQGIDPNDIGQLSPLKNFEFLIRNHLGFDVKTNNVDDKGLITFNFERVIDEVTKEPLSWNLWLRQIPSHDWKEVQENMNYAVKVMASYRGLEIPNKLAARQARMDLSTKGLYKIPPLEVLAWEQMGYNRMTYAGKISQVLQMLEDGDITEEDAFFPVERYTRFREGTIVGVAQEGELDYKILEGAVAEFEALEKTDPAKFKWVSEFMRIGHAIGAWYVDYSLDAELITADQHAMIRAENLYYLMFQRAISWSAKDSVEGQSYGLDPLGTDGGDIPKITMKAVKGGEELISHPVSGIIGATHSLIKMGDYNRVIQSFASAFMGNILEDPLNIPTELAEIAVVRDVQTPGGIYFKWRGLDRWLLIRDKEVARTFKKMVKNDNGILKLLTAIPRTLQTAIVMSPQFMLRNFPRDLGGYLIYGEDQKYLKARNLRNDRVARDRFELGGGGQFGFVPANKHGYNELLKILMLKVANDPKKWLYNPWISYKLGIDKIRGFAALSERATRMMQFNSTFNMAKEKYGLGDAAATTVGAFKARDLMDFQAAGEYVKFLNQFIIFSGAAVRGLEKVARSTRKNPKRMLARWSAFALLPSMLVPLLIAAFADEEQKEAYLDLPNYMRDMFYCIPAGDGWIYIPKPFELGTIASMGQRLLDQELLGDKHAFDKSYWQSISHMFNPYDMAGIMGGYGGIVATAMNYDFFRQKYIIPPSQRELAVVKRNTEVASKFGQDLQNLTGKDARMFDAFMQGQFAYWGDMFLKSYEGVRNIGSGDKIRRKWRFDAEDLALYKNDQVFGVPNVRWVIENERKYPDEFGFIVNKGVDRFQDDLYWYFSDDVQNNRKLKKEQGRKVRDFARMIRDDVNKYLKDNNTTLDDMAKDVKEYKNYKKNKK
jgi:hypothetical protein